LCQSLAGKAAATLAIFAAYAFIARQAIRGNITPGDMVMYFQAFQRGLGFRRDFLDSRAGLCEDGLFPTNLYELLDLKKKVVGPAPRSSRSEGHMPCFVKCRRKRHR
jgi:ATP-binding cassette subfamily B protein